MIQYVITDGCGSYIRKDNYSGKYVPVRNRSFAEKFTQRSKAENVLKNSVGKNIRSQYRIKELESETSPVMSAPKVVRSNDKNEVAKSIASETILEGQSEKWTLGVENLTEFIADAEQRKEELIRNLSEVDKEISDINHYIEFGKFNAYQGWLAFNMLRSKLKKRRNIKDELLILNQLGECKITSAMMTDIKNAMKELSNRKYAPRVLTALFD